MFLKLQLTIILYSKMIYALNDALTVCQPSLWLTFVENLFKKSQKIRNEPRR